MAVRIPLVIRNGRVEELPPDEKIKNCTETLKFTFAVAATEWNIAHNLGKRPAVSTVDGSGNVVHGDVLYIDDNTVKVTFAKPLSGAAYIN